MRRSAVINANEEAVVAGPARVTFAEAWTRAVRLANGLAGLGARPGDRVAVLEENCLAAADAFLGTLAGNFVRVALYARNSVESHEYMIGLTGSIVLIVDEKFASLCADFKSRIPGLKAILVRDAGYEAWLKSQSDEDPNPEVGPDDPCIIRFTAGTSGKPKAAMFTQQRWLSAARDWVFTFPPVQVGDACLHVAPLSHASGYLFTPVWLGGGRNIIVQDFAPADIFDLIERERIGYTFLVPTMLSDLIANVPKRPVDLSSLKVVEVGAAPIKPETVLAGMKVFGPVLHQLYSQTESGPGIKMSPAEWLRSVEGSEPLKSVGRPHPFLEIEVWDDDHRKLPPRAIGEVVIRGPGRMEGFWNDEEATRKRIVNDFVLTGDIGWFDENGYLYLVDRKNDMIISGGFNIWPSELEAVIRDQPGISDVVVFGIPHPRWGEAPMAVCLVERGSAVTEQQIVELCRDKLGSYKKPAIVKFTVDPLPRSPVGKITRKAVKELFYSAADEIK